MESDIHELVQLFEKDHVVDFRIYKHLEDTANQANAPGKESERAEMAAALAAELTAKGEPPKKKTGKAAGPPGPLYSDNVRNKLCRLLSYVAGADEVPALVEAMGDHDIREMARFALDRNTSEAATDALIELLEQIGPTFRAGVIGALGKRKGSKVLAALKKIAAEDEIEEIRMVAVEALADIADPTTVDIVMKATECKKGCHKRRAYKAAARLAGNLAEAGHKDQARQIYSAIQSNDAPQAQKKAAAIGLKDLG